MSLKVWSSGDELEASDLNDNFSKIAESMAVGEGQDGNVDLDGSNTYSGFSSKAGNIYTLTRDVFIDTLTVRTGCELKPNGYRIFAKLVVFEGTGKISAYGGDGGNANNITGLSLSTGGIGGAQANTAGTLPASLPGQNGCDGAQNGTAADTPGNGENTVKAINSSSATSSGAPGTGSTGSVAAGTSGTNSGTILTAWKMLFDFLILRDWLDDNSKFTITPSAGGGGGGGRAGSGSSGSYSSGGGGGGSGAPGGIVFLVANKIETVDGNIYIDVHGGNGGNGGANTSTYDDSVSPSSIGAGGGGGGAGGNGGVVLLVYSEKTGTGTINKSGGTGGSGGAAQPISGAYAVSGGSGSAGTNGAVGVEKVLQIIA